jgi:hypothetical protein
MLSLDRSRRHASFDEVILEIDSVLALLARKPDLPGANTVLPLTGEEAAHAARGEGDKRTRWTHSRAAVLLSLLLLAGVVYLWQAGQMRLYQDALGALWSKLRAAL